MPTSTSAQSKASSVANKKRARDLGIPLPGTPGKFNAITDVPGVVVGYATIISEVLPARTGVTAVLTRAHDRLSEPVWAGAFVLNGNGELTGAHWIAEAGWCAGPITITNTFSLGVAHLATAKWMTAKFRQKFDDGDTFILPVAAETFDGYLNDIAGFHVQESHVFEAIDSARSGLLPEGNVGGGTGMVCYEFKGGTGTSSRLVKTYDGTEITIGVLVQANHGLRPWLKIAGRDCSGVDLGGRRHFVRERGSIIGIIATDAPLSHIQLQRLARRAAIGIGRSGTPSGNDSGDIFLAFSTENSFGAIPEPDRHTLQCLSNDLLDPLFMGVVEAIDEAILNALVAAETMTGVRGNTVEAINTSAIEKMFQS